MTYHTGDPSFYKVFTNEVKEFTDVDQNYIFIDIGVNISFLTKGLLISRLNPLIKPTPISF